MDNPVSLKKSIETREYQVNLFNEAIDQNTLIVLPTGLGKTIIAAMVAAHVLEENQGKVLFLAPTRPLVSQHFETLKELLPVQEKEISKFTGEVDNEDRLLKWVTSKVVVATPQVVSNDLRNGLFDISKFGLVIFDEAHRATGNYAYVHIATSFLDARKKLILAITASPGGDKEKFEEITRVLGIEKVRIKSEEDEDVRKYVNEVKLNVTKLRMTDQVRDMMPYLKNVYNEITSKLKNVDVFRGAQFSRKILASKISEMIERAKEGEKNFFGLIPYVSAAIRVDYALEYLETQGIEISYDYLMEIMNSEEKTLRKTAAILSKIPSYSILMEKFNEALKSEIRNPKLEETLRLCESKLIENQNSRIIVFTHFRKTSELLTEYLKRKSSTIKPVRFVGQSSRNDDEGLSQKKQDEILDEFRSGRFNVLVATSVAEEGLDIPSTDLVVFYEPVPSEIRTIQRRGRTGRKHAGEVYILMYDGTRDSGYYFSAIRKEGTMRRNIKKYQSSETPKPAKKPKQGKKQKDLFDY